MRKTKLLGAHYLFVIIALISGLIFIRLLPPLWGLDEITHFDRSYQISTGNFFEDRTSDGQYGGILPSNLVDLSGYTYKDLVDSQKIDDQKATSYFVSQRPSKNMREYSFPGSVVYPPFVYAAPALGIKAAKTVHGSIGSMILAARLAILILYIVLVFAALYLLRASRAKWLVFIIALFPMAVSQASTVSADSLAIGLALLLFALLVSFWERSKEISWLQWSGILFVAVMTSLIKPIYLPLSITIVCLPAHVLPGARTWLLRALMMVILVLPPLAWSYAVHNQARVGTKYQLGAVTNSQIKPKDQLIFVAKHPLSFTYHSLTSGIKQDWYGQTFGLIGWNYVKIPSLARSLLFACLIITILWLAPARPSTKLEPLLFLSAGLLAIIAIVIFFYFFFNTVGSSYISGIQGRYFIPALPFLLYAIAKLNGSIKVTMSDSVAVILFSVVSGLSLAISLGSYFAITY